MEKYVPTEADYQLAEQSLTKEQEILTEWRELSDKDPDGKVISAFTDFFKNHLDELEIYENEILYSNFIGKSSYLSYLLENKKLTIALGTVFGEDQSPEELIDDLQELILQREMLAELGYEIEINRSEEIYELVYAKTVEPDSLPEVLLELKELLPQELNPFVFKHPLNSDDCDACGRTFEKGPYVVGLVDENNTSGFPRTNRWAARICNCYRCASEQPVAYRFQTQEEATEFIKSDHFARIENLKLGKKDIIGQEIIYFDNEVPIEVINNFEQLQRQREARAEIFGGNTNK